MIAAEVGNTVDLSKIKINIERFDKYLLLKCVNWSIHIDYLSNKKDSLYQADYPILELMDPMYTLKYISVQSFYLELKIILDLICINPCNAISNINRYISNIKFLQSLNPNNALYLVCKRKEDECPNDSSNPNWKILERLAKLNIASVYDWYLNQLKILNLTPKMINHQEPIQFHENKSKHKKRKPKFELLNTSPRTSNLANLLNLPEQKMCRTKQILEQKAKEWYKEADYYCSNKGKYLRQFVCWIKNFKPKLFLQKKNNLNKYLKKSIYFKQIKLKMMKNRSMSAKASKLDQYLYLKNDEMQLDDESIAQKKMLDNFLIKIHDALTWARKEDLKKLAKDKMFGLIEKSLQNRVLKMVAKIEKQEN